MSNNTNTELYELTAELMDEYTGTMWERILQRDLDDDDLESLKYHVSQCQAQSAMEADAELLGEVVGVVDRGEYPDVA